MSLGHLASLVRCLFKPYAAHFPAGLYVRMLEVVVTLTGGVVARRGPKGISGDAVMLRIVIWACRICKVQAVHGFCINLQKV